MKKTWQGGKYMLMLSKGLRLTGMDSRTLETWGDAALPSTNMKNLVMPITLW